MLRELQNGCDERITNLFAVFTLVQCALNVAVLAEQTKTEEDANISKYLCFKRPDEFLPRFEDDIIQPHPLAAD